MRAGTSRGPRALTAVMRIAIAVVVFATLGFRPVAEPLLQDGAAGVAQVTNATCPVLPDEPVDPEIWVDYEGSRVYLCCEKCRRLFEQDPASYVGNLVLPTGTSASQEEEDHHAAAEEPGEADAEHDAGEGHDGDHDHGEDHDRAAGGGPTWGWLGKFHPLVIHFPIALTFAAALAELLFLWRRDPVFRSWARFCLFLAAAGALGAASLGWLLAGSARYPADLVATLGWHRWLGVGSTLWLLGTTVVSEVARRRESPAWGRSFRVLLFGGIVLIGVTGHLGATLVFGRNYFDW